MGYFGHLLCLASIFVIFISFKGDFGNFLDLGCIFIDLQN